LATRNLPIADDRHFVGSAGEHQITGWTPVAMSWPPPP
jgi:hypothetical protein